MNRRTTITQPPASFLSLADPGAAARREAMIRKFHPEKGKAERIRKAKAALKAIWKHPVTLSHAALDRIINTPYYEDR